MADYLEVSGVNLSPYIQTMTVDDEPVWNTSAGRTLSAEFVGRIIARKWKLSLTTKPLTQAESAIILKALKKGDFVTVKFIAPDSGVDTLTEAIFYVNAPSSTVYSYADGVIRYKQLAFNLIQK